MGKEIQPVLRSFIMHVHTMTKYVADGVCIIPQIEILIAMESDKYHVYHFEVYPTPCL